MLPLKPRPALYCLIKMVGILTHFDLPSTTVGSTFVSSYDLLTKMLQVLLLLTFLGGGYLVLLSIISDLINYSKLSISINLV